MSHYRACQLKGIIAQGNRRGSKLLYPFSKERKEGGADGGGGKKKRRNWLCFKNNNLKKSLKKMIFIIHIGSLFKHLFVSFPLRILSQEEIYLI